MNTSPSCEHSAAPQPNRATDGDTNNAEPDSYEKQSAHGALTAVT